jgi:hypothetical protein
LQEEEAANHRGLRRLRAGVVSVAEKTQGELRHFGGSGSLSAVERRQAEQLVERRLGDHDAPTEADDGEFASGDELVAESAGDLE